MEEKISNLTSASGEVSVSSGNRYPQQSFASSNQTPAVKKKRNLPGNPGLKINSYTPFLNGDDY